MNKLIIAIPTAALLALTLPVPVSAMSTLAAPAQQSLQWLNCVQQQPNGAIGPGGANANPIARSAEVALSLAAAGQSAAAFHHGSQSLADYLKSVTVSEVNQTTTPVGTGGELLLARVTQPNTGSTADLVGRLTAAYQPTTGEYGNDVFSDALAILGLAAAGQPIPPATVSFLQTAQSNKPGGDHGWSFDNAGQFGSDSNTTALVIQAFRAAGVSPSDPAIVNGFTFLQSQFLNGGFVFQASSGPTPDANSDELAIQAIVAGHRDTDPTWAPRLAAAESNLMSLQVPARQPDAGALQGFDKLYATTLAPTAFLLRPLTVHAVASGTIPLLSCAAVVPASVSPVPRLAQTGGGMNPIGLVALAVTCWLTALMLWNRRRA